MVPVADPNLQLIFGALQDNSNGAESEFSEMETEITSTDMNPFKKLKRAFFPGTFQ